MRSDAVGIFWQDTTTVGRGKAVERVMPKIPETGWTAPKEFPNLSTAPVISLDTETYDPELETHGPGWARGIGHIVGISVSVPGGYKWYFPMRHTVMPEDNLNPEHVLAWARDTFGNPLQPKVGANLLYDVGWLREEGVEVLGDLIDVQYAEALLNENDRVGLDHLGERYLGEGKETDILYQWCADYYGGNPTGKQRGNIYRSPPCLVGPYAEADADLPLRIAPLQYRRLREEGLLDVYSMECRLIRLIIEMRYAGVTVDINRAEALRDTLLKKEEEAQARLNHLAGMQVDIGRSAILAKAFDGLGVPYGRTAKGAPSFTKEFLNNVEHPIGDAIREVRELNKLRTTFVEAYVLNSHINGKIHCQFHSMRTDGNGTRSGRIASSTPNLQNIPIRTNEGKLVRGVFVPDPGHVIWRRFDLSQIEYRFLVHYAIGRMSDEVRRQYIENPDIDYHELVRLIILKNSGVELDRKPTKNINFGLIYGMGIPKLIRSLGLDKKKGKELFKVYHASAPYVEATMNATMEEAERTGVITTILGRKSRFDLWEPSDNRKGMLALPHHVARASYGPDIQRAYLHKALNRRLQGSAAELIKKAMLKCYEDGVFNVTGVPRLTVHDELDFSDEGGHDDAFLEVKHIMETAIPLRIPVKSDYEVGPNWGDLNKA